MGYQLLLSGTALGGWVAQSRRGHDLLSLNKEGVCSTIGLWALHLAGVGAGRAFFRHSATLARETSDHGRWWRWAMQVGCPRHLACVRVRVRVRVRLALPLTPSPTLSPTLTQNLTLNLTLTLG